MSMDINKLKNIIPIFCYSKGSLIVDANSVDFGIIMEVNFNEEINDWYYVIQWLDNKRYDYESCIYYHNELSYLEYTKIYRICESK